ncbi:MAG: uroporphyrinogen-III synthase [Alcanivoracaceae bacterium]|nr:uroporphyrinogen-III synthase [Alcanivoracaceae bacterium]
MTKVTILNTRAIAQAESTREALQQRGFDVIDFPCIEIISVRSKDKVIAQLEHINNKDVIVFTSQYAVQYAYKINPRWQIKETAIVIAVGTKTAQILEQNFSGEIWVPTQQNSQGVIDLLQGIKYFETIKLISAEGGRKVIQRFAMDNKIDLTQINVYKRQLPLIKTELFQQIEQTDNLYILATSVSTINNLKALLPQKLWDKILSKKIICASARIETVVSGMGFKITENMDTANPEAIAEKLNIQEKQS